MYMEEIIKKADEQDKKENSRGIREIIHGGRKKEIETLNIKGEEILEGTLLRWRFNQAKTKRDSKTTVGWRLSRA